MSIVLIFHVPGNKRNFYSGKKQKLQAAPRQEETSLTGESTLAFYLCVSFTGPAYPQVTRLPSACEEPGQAGFCPTGGCWKLFRVRKD